MQVPHIVQCIDKLWFYFIKILQDDTIHHLEQSIIVNEQVSDFVEGIVLGCMAGNTYMNMGVSLFCKKRDCHQIITDFSLKEYDVRIIFVNKGHDIIRCK